MIVTRHRSARSVLFFFFNDTATTEIYTLSLHDALPICGVGGPGQLARCGRSRVDRGIVLGSSSHVVDEDLFEDRKSTRLNSSHANISYAVFCLKKKNTGRYPRTATPNSPDRTSQRRNPE